MRCRLSEFDRQLYERRARWTGLSEDRRDGHFRLYNKNAGTTLHVRVVDQVPNAAIWIVECDEVPEYFKFVLTPVLDLRCAAESPRTDGSQ